MDGAIGEVRLFAGNFAPRGWLFCHGPLLDITNNATLFSVLGTTYGGDGRNNFALPDLRGHVPVGVGDNPNLPDYNLGEAGVGGDKPAGSPTFGILGFKLHQLH